MSGMIWIQTFDLDGIDNSYCFDKNSKQTPYKRAKFRSVRLTDIQITNKLSLS